MPQQQGSATAREVDPAEEAQILDAIQKWLERDVRPNVKDLEHADEYPHVMVEQMKAFVDVADASMISKSATSTNTGRAGPSPRRTIPGSPCSP